MSESYLPTRPVDSEPLDSIPEMTGPVDSVPVDSIPEMPGPEGPKLVDPEVVDSELEVPESEFPGFEATGPKVPEHIVGQSSAIGIAAAFSTTYLGNHWWWRSSIHIAITVQSHNWPAVSTSPAASTSIATFGTDTASIPSSIANTAPSSAACSQSCSKNDFTALDSWSSLKLNFLTGVGPDGGRPGDGVGLGPRQGQGPC